MTLTSLQDVFDLQEERSTVFQSESNPFKFLYTPVYV